MDLEVGDMYISGVMIALNLKLRWISGVWTFLDVQG